MTPIPEKILFHAVTSPDGHLFRNEEYGVNVTMSVAKGGLIITVDALPGQEFTSFEEMYEATEEI